MPSHTIRVGDARIISATDGHIHFATSDFFPSIEADAWTPYGDQLTEEGLLRLNVGSFVVRVGDHATLIDTGLGEGDHPFENSEWGLLAGDLAAKGVSPNEIDAVFITHLHRDHVGWNIVPDPDGGDPKPYFPNARYYIPRADWRVFTRRAGMSMFAYVREQVMPLMDMGLLELVDGEQPISDHVTALPTPGHTPGHMSALITLGRRKRRRSGRRGARSGTGASHRLESARGQQPQAIRRKPRRAVRADGAGPLASGVGAFSGAGLRAAGAGRRTAILAGGLGAKSARALA